MERRTKNKVETLGSFQGAHKDDIGFRDTSLTRESQRESNMEHEMQTCVIRNYMGMYGNGNCKNHVVVLIICNGGEGS